MLAATMALAPNSKAALYWAQGSGIDRADLDGTALEHHVSKLKAGVSFGSAKPQKIKLKIK